MLSSKSVNVLNLKPETISPQTHKGLNRKCSGQLHYYHKIPQAQHTENASFNQNREVIYFVGMHNTGFFLSICWHFTTHLADNQNHTDCTDHQVSSVVEFTDSIIMHTLIMLDLQQRRHKIQSSNLCNIHSLCKRRKYLNLSYVKHVIFIHDNCF